LLSQNPSTGRNSRITNSSSANPVKLSLVWLGRKNEYSFWRWYISNKNRYR
jgi:hypothetical protein